MMETNINLENKKKDLLAFYRNVMTTHLSVNLWEVFDSEEYSKTKLGREDPKKMIRVDFGPVTGEPFMMGSWTLDQLQGALVGQDKETLSLNKYLIDLLEQEVVTVDVILVSYFNTKKMHEHGIPFDIVLLQTRPM